MLLATAGLAIFAWAAWRNPQINFLPPNGHAEWIIHPSAIDTTIHPTVRLDTRFRREFECDAAPQSAILFVRASRELELKVNGESVALPKINSWKQICRIDLGPRLRAGPDLIEARVFNDNGPPALWLVLETDHQRIASDVTWQTSFAGSTWQSAHLATKPRFPRPGHIAFGGETLREAWPHVWPFWLSLVIGGVGGLALCSLLHHRALGSRLHQFGGSDTILLFVIGLAWLALFWNNAPKLAFPTGFDAEPHLEYIRYLQEHHHLPPPRNGFEFYQPPLFYAIGAGLLSLCALHTTDSAAIHLLRAITMLCGFAQVIFAYLALRLLFPERNTARLIGLTIAGFLPLNLYLSHYLTNESLCGALSAAALYLALRLVQSEVPVTRGYLVLGLVLGAALLAKATAVFLFVVIISAFVITLWRKRAPAVEWLRSVGVIAITAFLVSSWHYLRMTRHLGSPLAGNWTKTSGFNWWQDPGYHTTWDYLRFGRVFVSPFFSGLNGIWDGIYSTLWGDGLCAGVGDIASRPPWNYNLMTAGYLLAGFVTVLLLAGAAIALKRVIQRFDAAWFILVGWAAVLLAGIVFMTLKVPVVGQARAVYGLSGLLILSATAALAWIRFADDRPKLRAILMVVLFLWASNSFASLWIRDSSDLHFYRAMRFRYFKQPAAALAEAELATRANDADARSHVLKSQLLLGENRVDEAIAEAEHAAQLAPNDTNAQLQLASVRRRTRRVEEALDEARRALKSGPENAGAYAILLPSLLELNRNREVTEAARDSLGVVGFTPEAHYIYGVAAGREGDYRTAADQLTYALLLRPEWEEARKLLLEAYRAGQR